VTGLQHVRDKAGIPTLERAQQCLVLLYELSFFFSFAASFFSFGAVAVHQLGMRRERVKRNRFFRLQNVLCDEADTFFSLYIMSNGVGVRGKKTDLLY
jgi:hypothetical protein